MTPPQNIEGPAPPRAERVKNTSRKLLYVVLILHDMHHSYPGRRRAFLVGVKDCRDVMQKMIKKGVQNLFIIRVWGRRVECRV